MERLKVAVEQLLAVRATESARRWAADVLAHGEARGEDAALSLCAVVTAGAWELRGHEAKYGKGWVHEPGSVTDESSPPAEGGYWWVGEVVLKTKLNPQTGWVKSGDGPPKTILYWCLPGEPTWHRVPDTPNTE